jgi:CBS domain containing-hemolysin-like protein
MLFSGFFSSAETSLFSLNKLQIEQMRRDDNPRIDLIERMLSEPRRLIVTILIGNEFVNVAASVISAAIVIQLFGAENKMVNLFIMVPILLLFGEITPKTLAIRNNTSFATFQCKPIDLFARMIAPLRWIIRVISEWFTTLIVGKELNRSSIVTRDMVTTLANEAVGDGVLDKAEAKYIEQIFDFGNSTVEDLMTPRSNIYFLSIDMPVSAMIDEIKRTRHTKFPVFKESRDAIQGLLMARDLLAADLEMLENNPGQLSELLREPFFVPETKQASDLFDTFRHRHISVALAVDEYGGVTGLISMEDLLEVIFGDIPSASDNITITDMAVSNDGSRLIDGSLSIQQFNQEFNATLEEGEFETVGGRILHELGEIPREGTMISLNDFSFTVTAVESNRLKTLEVKWDEPFDEYREEVADSANSEEQV